MLGVALSQALALQALLAVWGGALAVIAGPDSPHQTLCLAAAIASPADDNGASLPAGVHACLGFCLVGHVANAPAAAKIGAPVRYVAVLFAPATAAVGVPAPHTPFSARGPPALA